MISYEDPESVTAKAKYTVARGLGGAMVWELGSDDNSATLLNALASALI